MTESKTEHDFVSYRQGGGVNCRGCGNPIVREEPNGSLLFKGKAIVYYPETGMMRSRCTFCDVIRFFNPPWAVPTDLPKP